jgi:hypothetical protein
MKRLIGVAALAAFAAVAEDKPAAHAMPMPPEELKVEKWFVGSWSCKGQQHAGPMGPEMKTANKLDMKMELAGFWLQFKGTAQAGPMKGMEFLDGFATWDGAQHVRFDFQPGGMVRFTTKGWDGDKLVFDGEGMMGGRKMAMKHTITRKGDDAFDGLIETTGPDGKMAPMIEESCTRAAPRQK